MAVTEDARGRTECLLPNELFSPPQRSPAGAFTMDRWKSSRFWAVYAPEADSSPSASTARARKRSQDSFPPRHGTAHIRIGDLAVLAGQLDGGVPLQSKSTSGRQLKAISKLRFTSKADGSVT